MNKKQIVELWLQKYILELNLCPFAYQAVNMGKIIILEFKKENEEFIFDTFHKFLKDSPNKIESYFLIIDEVPNFNDFLEILYFLEDLTHEVNEFENIKIVGFHPNYMHGHVNFEVEHYTNRSPIPLIQLINNSDIEKRTKTIAVQSILDSNLTTLKQKGKIQLNTLLNEFAAKN